MRFERGLVTLGLVALSTACVSPARSFGAYEEKAVTTAETAVAAAGTARLTIRAATHSRGFAPFLTALLADSEKSATSAQGTFDSIQPPDVRSDELRVELDKLLLRLTSSLSELRIAARRGALRQFADKDQALRLSAKALQRFVESHQ